MSPDELTKRLKDHVLLFDGAMGTMLYARGIYINQCFDALNISDPKMVQEIHAAYVEAGVDAIETNTFGANRFKLEAHGFKEDLTVINREGAQLARKAVGSADILVAGSIGPLGIRIEPWGSTSLDEARKAFHEQAQALKNGGVDLYLLETFSDLNETQQAILAIREICDFPIIASVTIHDDSNTLYGTDPETFTRKLDAWGADVVGINCSVGPPIMLEALEKMVKVTKKPISVMPNAGTPRVVEGRNFYMASAEYMAEYTRRFIQTGAKIVGGCCGTTPDYIKAIRNAIRSVLPHKPRSVIRIEEKVSKKIHPISTVKKSLLGEKISMGRFVSTVEVVPPRGCDPKKVLAAVNSLKENAIDAVNIPDGPRAFSRMSAPYLSVLIQQEVGVETILHYTCRDRNLLGMMSDMQGLYAVGIKNLFIITGDPPKMGDYPDATAVFDVDSIGLVHMVNSLNHGVDLGGNSIGKPTGYLIGVGVNPGAIDLTNEINRFDKKVKAGAEYAITQPVFDIEILLDFLSKTQNIRIPIIAGIWPLVSLRNAEFMNNEVPGASVPDAIMGRMKKADSREKALREGIRIAQETALQVKEHVQGIQISAPFGNVRYALDVLSVLKQ